MVPEGPFPDQVWDKLWELASMDPGSTLCFARNAKEDELKADNQFISLEKMSICVRRKQEKQKAKKTGSPAEANDPVS